MKTLGAVSLFVMMVLVFAFAPATLAQEEGMFGLSAEDAAVFAGANAASSDASSVGYSFVLAMTINDGTSDITMNVTGDGFVSDNGFQLVLGGEGNLGGSVLPADAEIRVVDDTIYFRGTDPMSGEDSGWMSITGDDAELLLDALGEQLPVNPDMFTGNADPAEMEGLGEALTALMTIDPEEFIAFSRMDDMDGLAHFNINVDIAGFLQSDAFGALIDAAAAMDESGQLSGVSGADIAGLVSVANLTFDQFIDAESSIVEEAVLGLELAAAGASIDMTFDIDLFDYNGDFSVEAPADATPVTEMAEGLGF